MRIVFDFRSHRLRTGCVRFAKELHTLGLGGAAFCGGSVVLIKACNLHAFFAFQNPANFSKGGSKVFDSCLAVDGGEGEAMEVSIGGLLVGHRPEPVEAPDDFGFAFVGEVANPGDAGVVPEVAAHFYPVHKVLEAAEFFLAGFGVSGVFFDEPAGAGGVEFLDVLGS